MTHASVFSGIGGPEVAATMLGWDNLFHCEINPFGRKVLDYWYPNSKSYEDITTTDFTEWRGRVDVLTGGFPCQPFSYAGRRRGAEDDRYLWPSMYRAIDEIQPTWVVAENVAGILTMVEQGEVSKVAGTATLFDAFDDLRGRYELRETFTLQRICTDLESHGYAVQPVLVPACAVGAPHRRDRVFIVARRVTADAFGDRGDEGNEHVQSEIADGASTIGNGGERTSADTSHDGHIPCDEAGNESEVSGTTQGNDSELHDAAQADGSGRTSTESRQSDGRPSGRVGSRDADERSNQPTEREIVEGLSRSLRGSMSDTDRDRLQGWLFTERIGARGWSPESDTPSFHTDGDGYVRTGKRWDFFPSVSPVHRGNDGLPFDVDRLTISFGKWRTEALKAYGNAIVPQVMYEIFRAIEIVEHQKS